MFQQLRKWIEHSRLGLERVVHLENRLQDNLLAREKKSWLLYLILEWFLMGSLEILDYSFVADTFVVGNICLVLML